MTDLFALGARRLDWLAHREATIARNVANADTPGFRPSDLKPFEETLDAAATRLARTSAAHFGDGPDASTAPRAAEARGWETTLSGNAVSIEQELARAAETNRAAGVASAALKAFQRLSLAVAKG
ncbi:MAG: flagellar basal body rod protein FlgB [Rhodoblastus sp.]|nr:MAG: flagellar basal body rod protein FlgB [Rhodoblastus sp.]